MRNDNRFGTPGQFGFYTDMNLTIIRGPIASGKTMVALSLLQMIERLKPASTYLVQDALRFRRPVLEGNTVLCEYIGQRSIDDLISLKTKAESPSGLGRPGSPKSVEHVIITVEPGEMLIVSEVCRKLGVDKAYVIETDVVRSATAEVSTTH